MIYIHASLTVILTIKTVQTTGVRGSWMLEYIRINWGLVKMQIPSLLVCVPATGLLITSTRYSDADATLTVL